ncbi:gpW family head-tail joining protein [Burkholderia sp. BCC0405]|uniref:gpW family head-tail joining protein n=1 Tax=Burkholderia sp. BCC0405 TaxID=2676298 RepID=UPI00158D4DA1|nr:gpW family head-tail joining protein [Burkholderia sp. BCC0405]
MATCGCTSVLDGVPIETLRTRLAQMQQTYLDLLSGFKIEAASYSQADGSRSITYTRANLGDLVQAMLALQSQIAKLSGQCCNRRPPVTPFF